LHDAVALAPWLADESWSMVWPARSIGGLRAGGPVRWELVTPVVEHLASTVPIADTRRIQCHLVTMPPAHHRHQGNPDSCPDDTGERRRKVPSSIIVPVGCRDVRGDGVVRRGIPLRHAVRRGGITVVEDRATAW